MKLTEKTLEQQYLFHGKIIQVRLDKAELENGAVVNREVVEHPGGVSVAVLTENQELLFVRQFRYPYGETILELPAGKLEKGEDPFEAMQREQKEETGTTGTGYVSLGNIYPTPGYTNEIIRMWACRVESWGEQDPDDDEFIEVERIPLDKAVEMVLQGQLPDAKTQIGVLKTAALVQAGKL